MKYKDFKDEMLKQITKNREFFNGEEILTLHDFAETIVEKDFDDALVEKGEDKNDES